VGIINLLRLLEGIGSHALADALTIALQSHDSEVLKVALKVAGYAKFARKKVRPYLVELAQDNDAEVRYLAIEVAGLYRASEVSAQIRCGLASDEADLRHISLWALRKVRSRALLPTARSLLCSDNEEAVYASAEVLGRLQDRSSLALLREVVRDRHASNWVMHYVCEAVAAVTARSDIRQAVATALKSPGR